MKSMFKTPAWMIAWQQKHQPLLVEGLSDGPTYVRLAVKSLPAIDVALAFRPMAGRVTENTLMLGGKLAVFPLMETLKAEPASGATMANWLKAAFPNVEWPKVNDKRVGTIVAAPQQAPYYSGAEYLASFKESKTIEKMLEYIEQLTGGVIENRKGVLRAITDAYLAELPQMFDPLSLDKKVEAPATLPDAEFADNENVVKFVKKAVVADVVATLAGQMQMPDGEKPN